MGRDLGLDGVVDQIELVGDELDLLGNKPGATRLGFAALLKFLLWRGLPARCPRAAGGRCRAPRASGPRPRWR
jgi:hypothetical protein